jgi:arylformamidase
VHEALPWGTMSRAERDRAYNNTEAVINSAELNAARIRDSEAFRAARAGQLDLRYGPRARNMIDIFPGSDPEAPCLLFFHGGYWQRNAKHEFACLLEGVMAHGWNAALAGYTLCPDATMTEIVAEVRAALDWVAENGAAHRIAGKLIVSGWSAGGHLTALALAHHRVHAGLAISGIFELGPVRDTYLNEKLHLTDDEIAALSPLRLPVVHKPLAIAYGTKELPPLVSDSRRLHALRSAAHAPGALIPVAGADHFTIIHALRAADGELTRQALALS